MHIGRIRLDQWTCFGRLWQAVAQFAEGEIPGPLDAVAQIAKWTGVDEIGQENAIPGRHLGADAIRRMPSVAADGKGIAAIGGERHLLLLRHRTVGKLVVEDGADMRDREVARQIELHRDALPWVSVCGVIR